MHSRLDAPIVNEHFARSICIVNGNALQDNYGRLSQRASPLPGGAVSSPQIFDAVTRSVHAARNCGFALDERCREVDPTPLAVIKISVKYGFHRENSGIRKIGVTESTTEWRRDRSHLSFESAGFAVQRILNTLWRNCGTSQSRPSNWEPFKDLDQSSTKIFKN